MALQAARWQGDRVEGFARTAFAFDRWAVFARLLLRAGPIGNVAGVAERAGEMAFEDVSVEVFLIAAAHRLEKVAMMILAALEFLDLLTLLIAGNGARIIRHHHIAILAMDDHANAAGLAN